MNKKVTCIFIVFLILLSILPTTTAIDEYRSYSIKDGYVDIQIQDDGILKIREYYTYKFNGTYHGVTRNIPKNNSEGISNLNIYVRGAYAEYYRNHTNDSLNITTYLYTDKTKQKMITNKEVTLVYEYELRNRTKLYNDTGELRHTIWNEAQPVDNLTASITFPSQSGVEYWINPYSISKDTPSYWNGSSLIITRNLSTDKSMEFRAIIPKNEFKEDSNYIHKIYENGLEDINKNQKEYENNYKQEGIIIPILIILEITSLIIPFKLYKNYKNEKTKLKNIKTIETNISDKYKPQFINAILNNPVGTVDNNALITTIVELINKNYITYYTYDDDIILNINDELELLSDYERDAISVLDSFKDNNEINLNHAINMLKNEKIARNHMINISLWKSHYKTKYIDNDINKYFNKDSLKGFSKYGIIMSLISIILMIISFIPENPIKIYLTISSIIMFIISLSINQLSKNLEGEFTSYGKKHYQKCMGFKNYLDNKNLIKETPPENKDTWNKYVIYATALNKKEQILQVMKEETSTHENTLYTFYNIGGFKQLDKLFNNKLPN